MRNLLEVRELLKRLYSKYEVFIVPVLKFVLALAALIGVNRQLGYMKTIARTPIVLIAALLCSFLPSGFIVFFSAVFILMHFYALAMEAALVGVCLFLVMFLLFLRFSPKDAVAVVLTPIFFGLRIPYIVPLAMGLVGTPASAVSVGCGIVVYYLVSFVSANATAINAVDTAESTARLRMVVDGILGNKDIVVVIAAFAFTVMLVYAIRRMSIDHSWTIAIFAGTIVNMVILLIGDLMFDTKLSVIGALFGSVVSLMLAMVLQFFVFSVDYNRTEKVQFEDDEYYYYVKAVPKMTVATPEKTVKRINSQTGGAHQPARNGVRQPSRNSVHQPARGSAQRPAARQTPSRTVSSQRAAGRMAQREEIEDDFEEI